MVEIPITISSSFENGYLIKMSQQLLINVPYYLEISDGRSNISKIYTPLSVVDIIIDVWGSTIPTNLLVCFTLTDTPPPCQYPVCTIVVE